MGNPTKTPDRENFPVASLLLASNVRADVLAFYRFARMADDIADSADMSISEKYQALDEMETDNPFLQDLMVAFRQDVEKNRYQTWDELIQYCQYSANPVGQFLLDIHGEQEGKAESDALCTALQILNHLQDCQKDYQHINRIYIPMADLGDEAQLARPCTSPHLRSVLNQMLDQTAPLIQQAAGLPKKIKNRRLRYQAKVTLLCAMALAGKLRRQDPLATRVELTKLDKILIAYKGLYPL